MFLDKDGYGPFILYDLHKLSAQNCTIQNKLKQFFQFFPSYKYQITRCLQKVIDLKIFKIQQYDSSYIGAFWRRK